MKHGFRILIAALLVMQAVTLFMPAAAQAQAAAKPPAPAGATTTPKTTANEAAKQQCTSFKERQEAFSGTAKGGLLTDIYNYIKSIVDDSTKRLYETFINNAGYQLAVYGALTLMIVIFGVGFIIGVIQPSFGQVLVRLIKMGIIFALISPGGWKFFSNYMVRFFNDGTDELVRGVTAIGTGVPAPAGASPFYQFDKLANYIIQPDTFIAILGSTFTGGPYGMAMSGLMIFAIVGFVQLLIKALRTYAVSYVARALLLGLAPIFFVFLLFEKTKQLFMTWLNALLSLMLQPILLFTFLSFFMVLIESATVDMLNTEFCWTEFQSMDGAINKKAGWRALDKQTGSAIVAEMDWRGTFDCIVRGEGECPEFPINVIDVLTFLILVYLAQRFAGVIDRIANELANTYIALDAGGRFQQFMSQGGSGATRQVLQQPAARPATPAPAAPTPPPTPQTGRPTPGGT